MSMAANAQDIQKVREAEHGPSSTNPGPENSGIRNISPNTFLPPDTDHGEVQTFWSSFSSSHRRVQEGGWSRQVTVNDFPIRS
jgi:oxalate decarboxylase